MFTIAPWNNTPIFHSHKRRRCRNPLLALFNAVLFSCIAFARMNDREESNQQLFGRRDHPSFISDLFLLCMRYDVWVSVWEKDAGLWKRMCVCIGPCEPIRVLKYYLSGVWERDIHVVAAVCSFNERRQWKWWFLPRENYQRHERAFCPDPQVSMKHIWFSSGTKRERGNNEHRTPTPIAQRTSRQPSIWTCNILYWH